VRRIKTRHPQRHRRESGMQKVFEFLHSGSALAFARVPEMMVDLFNGLKK
jgi:hypothetical protein